MLNTLSKELTAKQVRKDHAKYNLGGFLMALRKALKLSRSEVGKMIGKTPQSLFLAEKSKHIPRIETLLKLSAVYNVKLKLLMEKIVEKYE